AEEVTFLVQVLKGIQTINFTLPEKTVGDAPFEIEYEAGDSGNPVVFTSSDPQVATVEGAEITIVGSGVTTITANQAGNDFYEAAASVEVVFTVQENRAPV